MYFNITHVNSIGTWSVLTLLKNITLEVTQLDTLINISIFIKRF